nr:TetR/AcrR family transcriptional regulator [Saccharopolyspora gloriosae]
MDPSLVIRHYGSKNDLFTIAIRLPGDSTEHDVAEHLFDVVDVRLGELPAESRALVRSMLTAPEATAALGDFLNERTANLAHGGGEDAGLRAAPTASSILGLTIARRFLKLDALGEISEEQIEKTVRPWITAAIGDGPPAERRRARQTARCSP